MTQELPFDGDDAEPILALDDLRTHFPIRKGLLRREVGRVRAVDGVSLQIDDGEILGVVGESGSGKSTVAHSILGLVDPTDGEIRFRGRPRNELSKPELWEYRRRIQLVTQDPSEAFSPRMRIGEAVAEPLKLHGVDDTELRRTVVKDILERVGLSADDVDRYPHEFSGGEKQRIAIARALIVNPDLIVADEPTSGLDGRVQSTVLSLLDSVRREHDIAILFISHDLDVVRRFCDRVAVMYLGEIVERGATDAIIDTPQHPYTRVLINSIPDLEPDRSAFPTTLTDTIPDPASPPDGCRFHTRCPELIPPAAYDLDPDIWRAIAAFRFTLQSGELPAEFDLEDSTLDAAKIREAFDLPDSTDHEGLDESLATAVESLSHGDIEAAQAVLVDAVPTVCERERPRLREHHGSHVRCHRHDPEKDATAPSELT